MTTSERTRNAAWRSVQPRISEEQRIVLGVLKDAGDAGLTDEGLWNRLRVKRAASIVARRNELVKLGRVTDSGRTRANVSGCMATVWVAVKPEGQGELFPAPTLAERGDE